jgi:hypothetical protein
MGEIQLIAGHTRWLALVLAGLCFWVGGSSTEVTTPRYLGSKTKGS